MKRPSINGLALSIFQAFFVYAVLAPTSAAWAQTIGDSITGGMTGVATMPVLINYIAYIAGFVVAVTGLLKVKDHVVAPDRTPLSHGLWRLGASGLLISLPAAAQLLMNTIKTSSVFGTTAGAVDDSISIAMSGSISPSLDEMMINLIANIRGPMGFLIWSLSAILGLFFLVSAFVRMAKGAGQDGPRGSLGSGTVGRVVIGAILLSLAATADVFTSTIFGSAAGSQFSGMSIPGVSTSTLDHAESVMAAILVFVQIIGFIAFMRGFLMLRALADGNNGVSTAAAATHIVGGAVAINIAPALKIIQTTVCGGGCSVLSF
jgi:hypothetical protein